MRTRRHSETGEVFALTVISKVSMKVLGIARFGEPIWTRTLKVCWENSGVGVNPAARLTNKAENPLSLHCLLRNCVGRIRACRISAALRQNIYSDAIFQGFLWTRKSHDGRDVFSFQSQSNFPSWTARLSFDIVQNLVNNSVNNFFRMRPIEPD